MSLFLGTEWYTIEESYSTVDQGRKKNEALSLDTQWAILNTGHPLKSEHTMDPPKKVVLDFYLLFLVLVSTISGNHS